MARKRAQTPDQESRLVPVPTVFITDSLHFETEYLAVRLNDAFHLVEKKEQLIRSATRCLDTVITDAAEMGILREECSLYPVSYTHLRAHETDSYLVCRLLLEKKKKKNTQ